jgi:hypothetical protein
MAEAAARISRASFGKPRGNVLATADFGRCAVSHGRRSKARGRPGDNPVVINPRKLAAIDIVFLGSKLIIAEFAGGVILCAVLGMFVLFRGHSFWQHILGLYLISLGINYVPMLVCAVAIKRGKSARAEISDELKDERRTMAKYRRQSILLLVPLLVPILALAQERGKVQAG